MSSSSRMKGLAQQISVSTSILTDFFSSNGLPEPSFDKDAALQIPDCPEEIQIARRNLREAAQELYALATGPSEHLRWLACYYHDCSSLRWIYHFNIAALVPLDGTRSYAEIASSADVDEGRLRRILRQAMTNRIFCEPQKGFVAHTAASSALIRDKGTLNWVGYTLEESFPASTKLVEATKKYGPSEEKNHSGWNLVFDTELPIFEYLSNHPDRANRFAETMEALTSTDGYNVRHLLNGYSWEEFTLGTVVDVGGSIGHASIAVAERFPNLHFIVQDLPDIVALGEQRLPPGLKDRVSFQVHDFFTPQPVQGADVYFLRFILHDYSDTHATLILKNLLLAFKPNSRLLVMDGVLPEPGSMPTSEERLIRVMDLEMMTNFNAKERDLDDWRNLFVKADPRLKVVKVVKPPGSVNSIIEAALEEGD
ncbi:uncharacterized protein Z518_04338 [Rhinocladiella mackenziei CBS 650.93]|uniref:Rhinocladiella mackenziei CBS 650.93 unplaced genomic scaffold supercont1.3, whole genome shotgun sequence n=1 Tax=Rhinocladiella mackenziei CBS 650.93 TaxID=1442369 RepID=A0A0D2FW27_9EURO|nr:uncharacterized protein Z518_04338 [Rhinocladiella mackenziei CBS 650.93]KIX06362.1 hypothetical protein Z518_04338 [Rhinocladiella mackenziei CBS 650.93]